MKRPPRRRRPHRLLGRPRSVGFSSPSTDGPSPTFEGMKVLFDDKVSLAPVQVQPRKKRRSRS